MDNKLNLVVQFSALDKLSGGLKNIIGLGRSGDQALRGMKRQARDLSLELKKAQAATAGATGNVSALIAKERQLEAAIAGVNTQIQRQQRMLAIDGTVSRVQARGQQLQTAGTEQMINGAGLITPFVLASKAAMDFGSGMVDIQQKWDLTNEQTARMARTIIALSRAAHRLPEEMRSGVDVLAGFGVKPEEAVAMIGPIGRLGTAFKVDLADGAAAAYANLNNLKVPLAQTGRALDIMAAGGKAGAFEIRDMARHFPELTAQMRALGQSGTGAVADLTAALQIARIATGDADTAGNNIKNLLAKINSPTVIRAFEKNFGVDLPAAMKKAYAQGKTPMEALAEITRQATGGDLSKLGFVIEDMQAQSALRILIIELDKYRKIRADIMKSTGATDAAFKQRELQDASVAWSAFKGQVSALAITLGTTLLPVMTRFFGYLNSGIGLVADWAQRNPELAGTLMQVVAGIAAAKIGIGALMFAFGSVIGPMATAWGWFAKLRLLAGAVPALAQLGAVFAMIRNGALLMAQGVMRAGLMMLANPMVLAIVLIGAALAGLAYLVYTNWDKIKAAFNAGIAWLKGVFNGLPGWMRSIGSMMMQGLLAALNPVLLVQRLLSVARAGMTAFKNFFGIKSPSRLFMQMGGYMTAGLAQGVDRGSDAPLRSMRRLAGGVAGAGALALAGPALGADAAPGRAAPPARAQAAPTPITFNIYQQPGEDAEALADRVLKKIEDAKRRKRRGSFDDDF